MNEIDKLKIEIFDLSTEQNNLNYQFQQLEEIKKQKMQQLQDLINKGQ